MAMICAHCKAEYVEGITVCGSCGELLVDALPPEPERPGYTRVKLATFADGARAALVSDYLLTNGVPVELTNQYMVGVNWLLGTGLGGIELVVPAEHEETARQLLASMIVDPPEGDLPAEFLGGHVDSATLDHERQTNRFKAILTFLLISPLLMLLALLWPFGRRSSGDGSNGNGGDA
jgi:hypothetical protein